jgi:hypothetical protein
MAYQHRRRPRTEAPGEVSQARLAAEALFAAPPPLTPADQPVVVVKRKRSLAQPSDEKSAEGVQSTGEEVRTPKVFRVESTAGTSGRASGNGDGDGDEPNGSATPRRRRRSRVQRGEVTIIRPAPAASGRPSEDDAQDFLDFPFDARLALQGYRALMDQVEELQQQALAVKKAEAAEAVRWIKRAIAEYGLSASELGL